MRAGSSWKISSRRERFGIIKSWFTFSNPHHPFDYAVNSTLFCIAFFIGATLAAAGCEGVRKSDVRSTAARTLGKQFRSRPYYEMRESVCIAMRRATFLHAACECRACFDRQPLRVRASSYLLATLFAINRETRRTCFVILFNQSGTAQITSCSAAAFNDRHIALSPCTGWCV